MARKFATKKRSQWLRLLRRQAMRRLLRPFTPLVVWCVCVVLPRHKPNTHTMGTKSKFHLNALRFDSIPFSIWFCFWTSASRSSPPARLSPSSSSFLLFLHRLRLGVSLCACAPSHVPSPSPSPSRSRGICYLYPARHNMCKKGGASRGKNSSSRGAIVVSWRRMARQDGELGLGCKRRRYTLSALSTGSRNRHTRARK